MWGGDASGVAPWEGWVLGKRRLLGETFVRGERSRLVVGSLPLKGGGSALCSEEGEDIVCDVESEGVGGELWGAACGGGEEGGIGDEEVVEVVVSSA